MATEACLRWDLPHLIAPASLIASELVSNVVDHAHTMMTLRLSLRQRFLTSPSADGSAGRAGPARRLPAERGRRARPAAGRRDRAQLGVAADRRRQGGLGVAGALGLTRHAGTPPLVAAGASSVLVWSVVGRHGRKAARRFLAVRGMGFGPRRLGRVLRGRRAARPVLLGVAQAGQAGGSGGWVLRGLAALRCRVCGAGRLGRPDGVPWPAGAGSSVVASSARGRLIWSAAVPPAAGAGGGSTGRLPSGGRRRQQGCAAIPVPTEVARPEGPAPNPSCVGPAEVCCAAGFSKPDGIGLACGLCRPEGSAQRPDPAGPTAAAEPPQPASPTAACAVPPNPASPTGCAALPHPGKPDGDCSAPEPRKTDGGCGPVSRGRFSWPS